MRGKDWIRGAVAVLAVATLAVLLSGSGAARTRFSHEKHQEVGADCATCHPNATESQTGKDNLLPTPETCQGCHEASDLELWGWTKIQAVPSRIPAFSHSQHLGMGVDCARCHGALVDPSLRKTDRGQIGHPVCFECHDGKQASQECETCHENTIGLRPLDHGPDFRHTHQFKARGMAEECESCHRESEQCSECHQGENVLFPSHPRNYEFTHAQDARKHETDCTSCHQAEQFCNDCHASVGVKPTNHDENWVSFAGGANRHALEARRDITYCAACHDQADPVCVDCHRDARPGRGNDRSIHPSDFEDYDVKGPWHDDDAYYCYDCHTKSAGTEGFCTYCHAPRTED
ncbi:MAG: cytochrome c3 family protein [Candidatus Eisenbacteria bacterium]